MKNDNCLVFRIKLSKSEVQDILIRYLQMENLINGNEEKYFSEMTVKGKHFLFEFAVPLEVVKQKDE